MRDAKMIDTSTSALDSVRVRLRTDLGISLRTLGGDTCCVIEDLRNGDFFRVGITEYTVLSLLDGKRTVAEVFETSARILGEEAPDTAEMAQTVRWLVEQELATTDQSASFQRTKQRNEQGRRSLRDQWLNPTMLKLSLGSPDGLISAIYRYFAWLFHWCWGVVSLAVGALAVVLAWQHASRFLEQADGVFVSHHWWYLAVVGIGLKLLHELGHALTCKHFGGEVRDCGLIFIVFVPLPYVDVTSSWRFESRTARILTSAAGMLVELFLAASAAIVWSQTHTGSLNQLAYNVMITAGLVTVLFNANPLMRFDGYYILSDWFDMPNLATDAQQYTHQVFRSIFFGGPKNSPTRQGGYALPIYGFAALAWRILVFLSLSIAAFNLMNGVGLIVSGLAVLTWLMIPFWKLLKFLVFGSEFGQPNRIRFAMSMATLVSLSLVVCNLPGPSRVVGSAIIQYDPLTTVRAPTQGFVQRLAVDTNQQVSEFDVLAVLENPELRSQYDQVCAELERTRVDGQRHLRNADLARYEATREARTALESKQDQLEKDLQGLVIRSPVSGRVVTGDLDVSQAAFVKRGQSVAEIGDANRKKALVLIHSEDAHRGSLKINQEVQLRIFGSWSNTFRGSIARVHPRASARLPHHGFASTAGGLLPVVQQAGNSAGGPDGLELTHPHVAVEVSLSPHDSQQLLAGQLGQATLTGPARTVADYLQSKVWAWVSRKVKINHGI